TRPATRCRDVHPATREDVEERNPFRHPDRVVDRRKVDVRAPIHESTTSGALMCPYPERPWCSITHTRWKPYFSADTACSTQDRNTARSSSAAPPGTGAAKRIENRIR